MDSEPRALTSEEVRDKLFAQLRTIVSVWSGSHIRPMLIRDRVEGAVLSVLHLLDGEQLALPKFELVARPHPDDKQYCIESGEDWIEDGTVIADVLHERWNRSSTSSGPLERSSTSDHTKNVCDGNG